MDYKKLYEQAQEEIARLKDERDQAIDKVEVMEDSIMSLEDTIKSKIKGLNDKVESFCAYLTGDWKQFRAVEETFRETYTEEFIQANKEALNQYGLFDS